MDGSGTDSVGKEKLLQILKNLLDCELDLGFLLQIDEKSFERLVVAVRARIGKGTVRVRPGVYSALSLMIARKPVSAGQLSSRTRKRPVRRQARSLRSRQCPFYCLGEIGHRQGLDDEPANSRFPRFRLGLTLCPGEKNDRDIAAQLEEFLGEKQP